MKEYQKYEYCINGKCPQIVDGKPKDKHLCENVCDAWSFHNYIKEQGYKIIKEDKEPYCGAVDHYIQGVS